MAISPGVPYLVDGLVQVTSEWARFGDERYEIGDIEICMVGTARADPRPWGGYSSWWSALAAIMTIALIKLLPTACIAVPLILGAIILIAALLLKDKDPDKIPNTPSDIRVLTLKGSFGKRKVFATMDRDYAFRIVDAISAAQQSQKGLVPAQAVRA